MSHLHITTWVLAMTVLVPARTAVGQDPPGPLLAPTGAWRVGRAVVEAVDPSRSMGGGRSPRRLVLHIWYPATPAPNAPAVRYMAHLKAVEGSLSDDELALLRTVQTHAFAAPAAAPPAARFPMVLFSHGEQANAFLYSNLTEELASQGNVVVGVDHPEAALVSAYADGTVVRYSAAGRNLRGRIADRAADLRFVREQVRVLEVGGRRLEELTSERVGVFGHSSGGIAAATLCQQSASVDACLNLDGRLEAAPILTGPEVPLPSRPFMYATKPLRHLSDAELQAEGMTRDRATKTQADTWAKDAGLLAGSRSHSYRATFHQATHDSFSDEALLREPGDLKNASVMRAVRALLVEFFDAVLASPQQRFVTWNNDDEVSLERFPPPYTP